MLPPLSSDECTNDLVVKVTIKTRVVTVTGPRGTLTKNLDHLAVSFKHPKEGQIAIELHHGKRKAIAALRTVRTIVQNLIIGVTRGFKYKMRYVYAHFPINVNIEKVDNHFDVEIRNFLGEKIVRRVAMREGVTVETSKGVKDQIELTGNSVEDVSQSAADIQQACRVRNKDIRKVSCPAAARSATGPVTSVGLIRYSSWTVCTCQKRAMWSTRNRFG